MNIIGTGLSGLVGSRIIALLGTDVVFENLSKETGVDIMDFGDIRNRIASSKALWVFHFAAYTDVQGAENEKDKGEESISWSVNVKATHNIAAICRDLGKKLLYISTDYVFDGKALEYGEDAVPNPISWYGRTKYEGEKAVRDLGDRGLIIRITNPYRSFHSLPGAKKDFVHKIMERLENGQEVTAPSDQEFSPTFVDDLGEAIGLLIEKNASGVYHVVSKEPLSPYKAAQEICQTFGFSKEAVKETTYDAYFGGKALPPKHASLKHGKIDALGVNLHTFHEGIEIVKLQEQKG